MKAVVTVFTYGGIHPATDEAKERDYTLRDGRFCVNRAYGDADIGRLRGRTASNFLRDTNADVLVMIDHDIDWLPGDVAHIAEQACETRAIVGGLVSKRTARAGFGACFDDGGQLHEIGSRELVKTGPNGYVGGAFTAYHRSVFEVTAYHHQLPVMADGWIPFFCQFWRQVGDKCIYMSEDWALCARAREAGVDTYVSMLPILYHCGEARYSVVDGCPDA